MPRSRHMRSALLEPWCMGARPMPTCTLQVCGPWALGALRYADVGLQPRQLIQGPGAARGRIGVWPCPPRGAACIAPQHLGALAVMAAGRLLLSTGRCC